MFVWVYVPVWYSFCYFVRSPFKKIKSYHQTWVNDAMWITSYVIDVNSHDMCACEGHCKTYISELFLQVTVVLELTCKLFEA